MSQVVFEVGYIKAKYILEVGCIKAKAYYS